MISESSGKHAEPGSPARHFIAPREFQAQLGVLYNEYLALVAGLAADDTVIARAAAARIPGALEAVDMSLLDGDAHRAWMGSLAGLQPATRAVAGADHIEALREGLPALTSSVAAAIRSFGIADGISVLRFHCPMAFDGEGAYWLQSEKTTANPYYGPAMFSCGEVVEDISDGEIR